MELASRYSLEFPEYLENYETETEVKGYLPGVKVITEGEVFEFTVFDPNRLALDCKDDMPTDGYVVMSNVLVVSKVTKDEVERAVGKLSRFGFDGLKPNPRSVK